MPGGIVNETSQQISINGEPRTVPSGITVEGLLDHLEVDRRHVAVEQNRKLVVKADYSEVELEAGDFVEIVTFVGGG